MFNFNKAGCCEKPIVEMLFNEGKYTAKIYLAEKNGKWVYGYHYTVYPHGGGGCCGACIGKQRTIYKSEMECRFGAISELIRIIKSNYIPEHKPIIEKLESELLGRQLNIFELSANDPITVCGLVSVILPCRYFKF